MKKTDEAFEYYMDALRALDWKVSSMLIDAQALLRLTESLKKDIEEAYNED